MRRSVVPALIAGVLLLSGCGTPGPSPAAGPAGVPTPSGTATAACPEQPGVELPPGCAGYDPDDAMALNEQYRERMPLEPEYAADLEDLVAEIRTELDAVRQRGVDESAVRAALEDAGLAAVQSRSAAGDVLFGAVPQGGGCIYGAVEADAVTVDAGGFIMDGGCLPAQ